MTRRNQGRPYSAQEWLEFMIEGEIESQGQAVRDGEHELPRDCYDVVIDIDAFDVEITPDLAKAKANFERDIEAALKQWIKKHPLEEDVYLSDLLVGAPGDVYLSLDGSGAGDINYGEWNKYFVDGDDWDPDDLINFLEKKVGKYVDDAGGGQLPMEMSDAVYQAFVEACDDAARRNPLLKKVMR